MLFSVPLYFRVTTNASNTRGGSYLFPSVMGNAIGGIVAGYLIRRTGRYKVLSVLAAIPSCITYLVLVLRWHGHIATWEVLETVPGGLGTGMVFSTIFIALTSSVAQQDIAISSGGIYLAASFGMLSGIAVASSVQLSSLRSLLVERVSGPGSAEVRPKPLGIYRFPQADGLDHILCDFGYINHPIARRTAAKDNRRELRDKSGV
jgi:MFS family permease